MILGETLQRWVDPQQRRCPRNPGPWAARRRGPGRCPWSSWCIAPGTHSLAVLWGRAPKGVQPHLPLGQQWPQPLHSVLPGHMPAAHLALYFSLGERPTAGVLASAPGFDVWGSWGGWCSDPGVQSRVVRRGRMQARAPALGSPLLPCLRLEAWVRGQGCDQLHGCWAAAQDKSWDRQAGKQSASGGLMGQSQ